jgi:hypothetical protein
MKRILLIAMALILWTATASAGRWELRLGMLGCFTRSDAALLIEILEEEDEDAFLDLHKRGRCILVSSGTGLTYLDDDDIFHVSKARVHGTAHVLWFPTRFLRFVK